LVQLCRSVNRKKWAKEGEESPKEKVGGGEKTPHTSEKKKKKGAVCFEKKTELSWSKLS